MSTMQCQESELNHDATLEPGTSGLKSRAYILGHDVQMIDIWQSMFFDHRDGEDCVPILRDHLTSAIKNLAPFMREDLLSRVEPLLCELAAANAKVAAIRRGKSRGRKGTLDLLWDSSRSASEQLRDVIVDHVFGDILLREWFRFGCAIGRMAMTLTRNPNGPVPTALALSASAKRLIELDDEAPASVHVLASAALPGDGQASLSVLRAALERAPRAIHDTLSLDLLYATMDLDREIRRAPELLANLSATEEAQPGSNSMGSSVSDSGLPSAAPTSATECPHPCLSQPVPTGPVPSLDQPTSSEKVLWFHECRESMPKEFRFGPLEGSLKELAKWIFPQEADPRTIASSARRQQFGVFQVHRTLYEIWFRSDDRLQQAKAKQEAAAKMTLQASVATMAADSVLSAARPEAG
ncbi:MAG: hypothetical protein IT428_06970 [Planctomycetaceae bacterium]|nr:hypothetical protein [Planctomycetaceae bacterium]